MPMQRIGYGIAVVGMIGTAAIFAVSTVVGHEGGNLVVPAIFAFAASTIGGVLAVLAKLEKINQTTQSTNSMVDGQRDVLLEKIRSLEERIDRLVKDKDSKSRPQL